VTERPTPAFATASRDLGVQNTLLDVPGGKSPIPNHFTNPLQKSLPKMAAAKNHFRRQALLNLSQSAPKKSLSPRHLAKFFPNFHLQNALSIAPESGLPNTSRSPLPSVAESL